MLNMFSQSSNPKTFDWYNSMTVEELQYYASLIRMDIKHPPKWLNVVEAKEKLKAIEKIVINKTTGNLWENEV